MDQGSSAAQEICKSEMKKVEYIMHQQAAPLASNPTPSITLKQNHYLSFLFLPPNLSVYSFLFSLFLLNWDKGIDNINCILVTHMHDASYIKP